MLEIKESDPEKADLIRQNMIKIIQDEVERLRNKNEDVDIDNSYVICADGEMYDFNDQLYYAWLDVGIVFPQTHWQYEDTTFACFDIRNDMYRIRRYMKLLL